jgi:hypothetical protein
VYICFIRGAVVFLAKQFSGMKAPASIALGLRRTAWLAAGLFLLVALPARAQEDQQGGARAQTDESAERSAESSAGLIDGVTLGGGLVFYQGDLDTNPENNVFKFLGASNLSLLAGIDRRYAGGYTLGLELSYDRLAGKRQFGNSPSVLHFSNNLLSLNAVGSIDTGLFQKGVLRAFLGVGPTLMARPQYKGFSEGDGFTDDASFKNLGTRVRPNLALGINVQDAVRLGVRALPTDYVDGFTGVYFPFDQVVFLSVTYRFDLAD